ncbi:MAG: hypothetical protein BroJett038_25410 [Chloroflexota bacterium]|nr:MAG: hypothetical protein BroJett038_25410 [Chloroflexota bacterium]
MRMVKYLGLAFITALVFAPRSPRRIPPRRRLYPHGYMREEVEALRRESRPRR